MSSSFVSTQNERDGLYDEGHEVLGLRPALEGDLVALLHVDGDLATDHISTLSQRLDKSQEAWNALACLGLSDEVNVIAFKSLLQGLRVATLL